MSENRVPIKMGGEYCFVGNPNQKVRIITIDLKSVFPVVYAAGDSNGLNERVYVCDKYGYVGIVRVLKPVSKRVKVDKWVRVWRNKETGKVWLGNSCYDTKNEALIDTKEYTYPEYEFITPIHVEQEIEVEG